MDIANDDAPVGRVLSRKEVIALFRTAGMGLLLGNAGCGGSGTNAAVALLSASPSPTTINTPTLTPSSLASAAPVIVASPTASPVATATPTPGCVAKPELTEGPYFVDERLNRSDIRTDPATGAVSEGTPLTLKLYVSNVSDGCAPVVGGMVDVWHADAHGKYSDVASEGTAGKEFLRGFQNTDANGSVTFTTIYPGWYAGRAVHIHFKVRGANGENYEFTSQFFFDEALTDEVYTESPYNTRDARTTRNETDGVYRNGGSQLVLPVAASGSGYAATFTIGLTV